MPFDLAADPWGTAMLASAGLWVLSATVVVIAWFARTSARTGGNLMLVALLGFLVSAAGGTWERIQTTDAIAARPPAPEPTLIVAPPVSDEQPAGSASTGAADRESDGAERPASAGASTGDAATEEAGAGGTGEPAQAEVGSTGDGGAGDEGAVDDGAVDEGGAAPPVAPGIAVEPLPSDPEAREDALRELVRATAAVADSTRRCGSLDEVANAWAQLRRVPNEAPWDAKARDVTKRLEKCRRKLLYSASRRHRREQIDARDAFAAGLAARMQVEHGLRVAVAISGNSHERLRVGGKGLDAARAEVLMNEGLRRELQELGFGHVVLSDSKIPITYEFETTPESELGLPDLRAVGLGEPLAWPTP